jgi:predicted amidophosphoribosyltransferase
VKTLHAVAGLIPALCAACGRSCRDDDAICTRCARRLSEARPLNGPGAAGLDRVWSAAPHDRVARQLVAALKFRRLLPVADLIAEQICWLAPSSLLSGTIVPVPTATLRVLRRGFDPATEIALALAERTGAPLATCLVRRGSARQVGRRRAQRLGQPPRFRVYGQAPRSVLLVDDVMTTGATLSGSARVLRAAGAHRVVAITFTRRL